MATRKCRICGEEFVCNSMRQYICKSRECYLKNRRQTEKRYYHTVDKYKSRVKLQAKSWGIKQRWILKQWLETYKKANRCKKCSMSDYRCLEFHHLNPKEKDYNIGKMITNKTSLSNLQKEVSKCIIICANCHRIEHFQERGKIRH
jgi:hypothetical protein